MPSNQVVASFFLSEDHPAFNTGNRKGYKDGGKSHDKGACCNVFLFLLTYDDKINSFLR
jgi:hypothetical protein